MRQMLGSLWSAARVKHSGFVGQHVRRAVEVAALASAPGADGAGAAALRPPPVGTDAAAAAIAASGALPRTVMDAARMRSPTPKLPSNRPTTRPRRRQGDAGARAAAEAAAFASKAEKPGEGDGEVAALAKTYAADDGGQASSRQPSKADTQRTGPETGVADAVTTDNAAVSDKYPVRRQSCRAVGQMLNDEGYPHRTVDVEGHADVIKAFVQEYQSDFLQASPYLSRLGMENDVDVVQLWKANRARFGLLRHTEVRHAGTT